MSERCSSSSPTERARGARFTQRGLALIAVTAALAVITVVTMEFNYQTNIDYASAANARDSMRAHFLARSVMNMSQLIIKVQRDILDRSRRQLSALGLPDIQIADFMSMLEVPMCGSKAELADMAALANVDASGMKGLGLDYGMCRVETFGSEDGKINLNCANGSVPTANAIAAALTGLVNNAAYDRLFEERDGDGQFTDRATFVKALLDYVDRDESQFGASGAPEDYGYESQRDRYRAKNNYIDSVEELQLARGMDDRKWELFGPELTVYGGCKVNVSATQSPIQMMALLFQSAKDQNDPVLLDPRKLYLLAQRVAQARALGMPFEDLNAFVTFVADPDAALGLKTPEGAALGAQSGMPPVEGIQLDSAKLSQVARAGARRTYRVVAAAQVGRVEKRITGVFDTETHNQNARDPAYARGAWVYWREE
jgi:general secretion pathway protein K